MGIRDGGPNGYPSDMLDGAIRRFQQDKGLKVDGVLKPGGPTITALGGLLGGGEATERSVISERPYPTGRVEEWPRPTPPFVSEHKPAPPVVPQSDEDVLIRIMNGGKTPEPRPQPQPTPPRWPVDDLPSQGGSLGDMKPHDWDRLHGHTINQDGIDANQGYAEMLVRDSDPSQTARMLKRTIDEYGNQGRGDVADLLGRFRKVDANKAETLRREIAKATGEMLPYRIAPLGEGFREPTEEDRIAAAPKVPFGPAQGADRWAAGNMADALLGKGDYADAITHFRGEIGQNRDAAMPYLAAVHEIMGEKNPGLAAKFATQMQKAGLTEEKKPETTPYPVPIPPAPTPAPTPEPPKPEPAPIPEPPKPEPTPTPEPPVSKPPTTSPAPTPKPETQPPVTTPAPDLHPSVTIEFDGKEFKAIENGKIVKNWPAVSGRPGFQDSEHQGEKDKGPLPEGEWVLRQDQLQTIDKISEWDRLKGTVGRGTWRGLEDSWGKTRVWLEPGQGTDTKGRSGFSVHGGRTPGSAGCIDLTDQMEDFADYFRRMGKDVKVRVEYKRK